MSDPIDITEGRRLLHAAEHGEVGDGFRLDDWTVDNLPALLDEVERLRDENEELKAEVRRETRLSIQRGMEDAAAGRLKPWSEIRGGAPVASEEGEKP